MSRPATRVLLVLLSATALVAGLLGTSPLSAVAAPREEPNWATPETVTTSAYQASFVTSLTDGRAIVQTRDFHTHLRDADGTWQDLGFPAPVPLPLIGRGVQVGNNEVLVPYLDYVRDEPKDLYVNSINLTNGAWGTPKLLVDNATPSGPSNTPPQAAVSDDGTVMVVAQNTNLGVSASARRLPGETTWRTFHDLPTWDTGYDRLNGDLAALSGGDFVLLQRHERCDCGIGNGSALLAWFIRKADSAWGPHEFIEGYPDNRNVSDSTVVGWGGEHPGAMILWRPGEATTILSRVLNPSSQQWAPTQPVPGTWPRGQGWVADASSAGAIVAGGSSTTSIASARYLPDPNTWPSDRQEPWQLPDLVASAQTDSSAINSITLGEDGAAYVAFNRFTIGAPQAIRVARGEQASGAWAMASGAAVLPGYGALLDTSTDGQPVTAWYRDQAPTGTVAVVGAATLVPELTAEIDAAVPAGGLAVDDETDVTVTLTASVDTDDVTVTLDVPGDSLDVIGTPTGTTGASLVAGVPRTWTWQVRAMEPGSTTVTVDATGTAETGDDVSATADVDIDVAVPSLALGATVAPEELELTVTEAGEVIEKVVDVTLVVRNTTDEELTGIVLERAWVRPQVETHLLDQLDFAADTFPITVGSLQPGEEWTTTLPVTVTGDGDRKVDLLASYTKDGEQVIERGSGGEFTTTVPPLWWEAKFEGNYKVGEKPWVKGGQAFFLSGSVRNLSDVRRLCLAPFRPHLTGNAGGNGVVDIGVFSSANAVAPPMGGVFEPGDDRIFGMLVRTTKLGSAKAAVGLAPLAFDLGDDVELACDAMDPSANGTALTPEEVTARPKSATHEGGVDISVPITPPKGWWKASADNVVNALGGFGFGAIETVALTLSGTAVMAREAAVGYTQNPALLLPSMEAIWAGAGMVSAYWNAASPQEKKHLYTQVISALSRAPGGAYAGLTKVVEATSAGWMKKVETAYGSGDFAQVCRAFGYVGGAIAGEVVLDVLLAELGVTITRRLPLVGKTFLEIGGKSRTYASMAKMPAGKLLNATEMRTLWGAAKSDIKAFIKIAKEEGVIIGIRSRAPISVKNIKHGAVWKHENLKPKNVSAIDIKWLEFDKADEGLVALRTYSKELKDKIRARIDNASLSDTQRKELLDRVKTRFEESDDYLAKIKKFDKDGEIDVGFNYSDNGIDEPTDRKWRRFKLVGDKVDGGTYYRPYQERLGLKGKIPKWCKDFGDALKVLCRVTGDMDGVYLAGADGRSLTKARVIQVYKRLADAGWQHPETFTWVDQMTGAFWFDKKEKILKGLTKGGEKMMEFGPDGKVRATWLNLEASRKISAQDFFVARIGGFTALRP